MEVITLETVENWEPKHPPTGYRRIHEFLSDYVSRWEAPLEEKHGPITTRWPLFNASFGGARSELIVLTGETGRGKTTFALNWLRDLLDQQVKCLCLSLEGGPTGTVDALAQMITGKDIADNDKADIYKIGQMFETWPLWLVDHSGQLPEDLANKVISYVCQEEGVKYVLVDHLDYIAREWKGRNESYVIGDCVRSLAATAANNRCTIVLITHPSKLGGEREAGMDDLKGSAGIKQEASSVLSIHRPNPSEDLTWLRFWKIRNRKFSRYTRSRISFHFDPDFQEYREASTSLDWTPVS